MKCELLFARRASIPAAPSVADSSFRFSPQACAVILILAVGGALPAAAQPASAVSRPAGETVRLTPFTVSGESVGSYQVAESTSGSRIRVNLFEATNSINVATSQLMTDLGATSPLAALKYLPGITRGVQPEGSYAERLTFRGYEITLSVMDGADMIGGNYFNRNTLSAFLDRIEVVMGTDSILSPSGVPGGTMNLVTKRPQFSNFGEARLQVGEYNSNQFSLDWNRKVSDRLALRVINAATYGDAFSAGRQRGYASMLSGTWQFRNGGEAMLQLFYVWGDSSNGGQKGIPIDPSGGTRVGEARPQAGLDDEAGGRLFETTSIKTNRRTATFTYRGQLGGHLSTRLVLRAESYDQDQLLPNVASSLGLGGAYDPRTGFWTPGIRYGGAPAFAPSPAVMPNTLYRVQGIRSTGTNLGYALQDDYALEFERDGFRSLTLAGVAFGRLETSSRNYTSPQTQLIDLATQNLPVLHIPNDASTWSEAERDYVNLYVNQGLKFLEGDRVALQAGVAKNWNRLYTESVEVPTGYDSKPAPLFANYGAHFKVTPDLAVYYGHSESAQPQNRQPDSVPRPDRTSAEQDEFGLRLKLLGGRGMLSVARYEILQTNFSVINPANAAVPAPVPRLPNLLLSRLARGWEYGFNAAISKELSLILSYTNFTNRDPNGVPIRGTAERAGAAWLRYDVKDGAWSGFGAGLGYVYQDRVAGDTGSGLAAASTPATPIPNQPSFWLPATRLINATVSYRRGPWTVRGFIDNVTDERFITSAISRSSAYVGLPRNLRLSLEYRF